MSDNNGINQQNNPNNENVGQVQDQPGILSKIYKIFFYFLIFSFISKLFTGGNNKNNGNSYVVQNVFDNEEFNINFYIDILSDANSPQSFNNLKNKKKIEPIITFENVRYSADG